MLNVKKRLRIGHVDDHETFSRGLQATLAATDDLELVAYAETVSSLLSKASDLDLVVLDLRLRDGSSPVANVAELRDAGLDVLVFTSGEDQFLVRQAARAGVLGVLLKTLEAESIVTAVRDAASGHTVSSVQWASAVDGDPVVEAVGLTERERQVLELIASGMTESAIARRLSLSSHTVNQYVDRVRRKYAEAARPARSQVDLAKRAIEDGYIPTPTPPPVLQRSWISKMIRTKRG
ncbi:LuxR C-terminal-related transcriptional regulator [Smaragdicoccus niigatensis]|uniref:LuxR C-terminal-related transcriptional regulator n=1 Tax=Smaragdicoccus niigatensis TaxID=359359 RepID=UPI0006876DA6|nr:response regulator transcription factor [Smaragdicoccus niigatensis]